MANLINWRDQVKFSTGDTIRVHQTVSEGAKTRTQIFEGVVIRIRGHVGLKSFTVRKIGTGGVGVERIYPEASPIVTKVEVKKKGKVRRAVLNYLKKRVGKKATAVKDKFVKGAQDMVSTEMVTVKKDEGEQMTPEQRKLMRSMAEEKAEKAAKKLEKEKKKSKKKAKIVRKEKVFVR